MKKILILTIALLFIAGLAMADVTAQAEIRYYNDYYAGSAANQFLSGGYAKIMFTGSNDFASIGADIKGSYADSTKLDVSGVVNNSGVTEMAMSLVDNAYIKVDVLGAIGVEGLPVKVTAIFGYIEIKGEEVWKVTRSELEASTPDAGDRYGQVAAEVVIMEMVTVKIAHDTTSGAGQIASYAAYTIAPTLISVKASIEFVDVAVNADIQQAVGSTDMILLISGGVAVDIAKILNMDLIKALKIGIGASADNATVAANYDIAYGAGINLELAPMDKLTVRFGISTYAKIMANQTPASGMLQNLGIDLEVWYDWIGLGANTVLAFGNKAGATTLDMLGQTEVALLAKLSGVDLVLGFIYNPEITNGAGDEAAMNKYANDDATNGNMGMFIKATCKI